MSSPPASVLAAGLLFLASAVYGLITGTLGLELFPFEAPRAVVVLVALIHVYLGLGLWSGDGFARVFGLWALSIGFFGSWFAMYCAVSEGTASVGNISPNVVNVFVTTFFVWHLSGEGAMIHSGAAKPHGDHAH